MVMSYDPDTMRLSLLCKKATVVTASEWAVGVYVTIPSEQTIRVRIMLRAHFPDANSSIAGPRNDAVAVTREGNGRHSPHPHIGHPESTPRGP